MRQWTCESQQQDMIDNRKLNLFTTHFLNSQKKKKENNKDKTKMAYLSLILLLIISLLWHVHAILFTSSIHLWKMRRTKKWTICYSSFYKKNDKCFEYISQHKWLEYKSTHLLLAFQFRHTDPWWGWISSFFDSPTDLTQRKDMETKDNQKIWVLIVQIN